MATLNATVVNGVIQATGAPTAGTPNSLIRWTDIFDSNGLIKVSVLPKQLWAWLPEEGMWHKVNLEVIDNVLTLVIDPAEFANPA